MDERFKKLSDEEIRELVKTNPQASQVLNSLRDYLSPEQLDIINDSDSTG